MARIRFTYAVAIALLVTVFFALPVSRPAVEAGVGVAAVSAVGIGIRRLRPQRSGAWRWLQVALALLAVGDAIFAIMDVGSPAPVPYPALPNVFYLALYPALTIALLWLGRPASRYRDDTTLLDASILTLAGGLIVWIVIVRPYLLSTDLSTAGRLAATTAWVGYITVLAASLRVLRYRWRNPAAALLAVAVFSFLVAEIFYGYELVQGVFLGRGPIDLGYFTFSALCGAVALHPSMRDIPAPPQPRYTIGPARLTTIVVALILGPSVLLAEASLGIVRTGVSIVIISGLVGVLILLRARLTGRAYQRRAAREEASRAASEALVAAITPQDVLTGVRSALQPVVHDHAGIEVNLLDPCDPDAPRGTVQPVGSTNRAELALPVAGTDAALVFAAPADDLYDLDGLLHSLADQAALALQRIRLAGVAAAEERDRHFRTLVLTSTDVILISRNGRIEYATPSAQTLVGRDVLGERVDDIVHPHRLSDSRPTKAEVVVNNPLWPSTSDATEATIQRPDDELTVLVHRRDLTDEPTVRGIVTTMRDITAERALQRDLAYRATHDELTGLANMRAWEEALMADGHHRRGPGRGIAVMAIDVDNFKIINDSYGHPVGDKVLAEVARRIQACLRNDDLAARIGGDEFAALLRGLANADEARTLAQRLLDALARPAIINSMTLDCKASIGLSYTEGAEAPHTLVRQADTALYEAKDLGRSRWVEHNPT